MEVKEGVRIIGTGRYLPERVVTNDDMSNIVDTNDEWIYSRTGIRERHYIGENETNTDMATEAARAAIENAGIDTNEIGALIVAVYRPDNLTPSTACVVQKRLNLHNDMCCVDINAACSGFIYGLSMARGLLFQTNKKYAVIVGSEAVTKTTNMTDRGTCILFGDGAGAVVIELTDTYKYQTILGSKGDDKVIICPNDDYSDRHIYMDGQEVFKFVARRVPDTAMKLIEMAGLTPDDIDYFVCHQANKRIIEAVAKRCKQPMEKFFINMDKYANTSSATIPIAFSEMNDLGLLKRGMKIVIVGFGGGLTWGGAYLEW